MTPLMLRAYIVLGSLCLAWVCRDSAILSGLFVLQARIGGTCRAKTCDFEPET